MRQHHRLSRDHDRHQSILKGLLRWGTILSISRRSSSLLWTIATSFPLLHLGFNTEVAQAYPRQTSVSIAQQEGDSYTALVRRAETAARMTAQQIFDTDILVSEVAITVVGESGTSIVPILTLRVSRDNWRTRPDPQQWSTYFRSARSLLELGTPAARPTTSFTPAPAPVPSAPVNPPETQSEIVPPTNIIPPANIIPPSNVSPANTPDNSPRTQPGAVPPTNTISPANIVPPTNQPTNQPANTSPANQPTTPSTNQTESQPTNQPANQSTNQPINPPQNQPQNLQTAPPPAPRTPTPPPTSSPTPAPSPIDLTAPASGGVTSPR